MDGSDGSNHRDISSQMDSSIVEDMFSYINDNFLTIYCRTWDKPNINPKKFERHVTDFIEELQRTDAIVGMSDVEPDSPLAYALYDNYRALVDSVVTPWTFDSEIPPDMTEERLGRYCEYITNNIEKVHHVVNDSLDNSPNDSHRHNLEAFLLAFDDNDGFEMNENELNFLYNYYRRTFVRHVYEMQRDDLDDIDRKRQNEYNRARDFTIRDIDYTSPTLLTQDQLMDTYASVFSQFTNLALADYGKLYHIYVAEWTRKREQGIIGQPTKDSSTPKKTRRKRKNPTFEKLKTVVDYLFLGRELQDVTKDRFTTQLMVNRPDGISVEDAAPHVHDLYDYYKSRYEQRVDANQVEEPPEVATEHEPSRRPILPFPFRSAKKRYGFFDSNTQFEFNPNKVYVDRIPDRNVKSLKKFMRPNFSPHPYAWEIDYLQYKKQQVTYLFAININTRYLYAIRVDNKSAESSRYAINKLIDMEARKGHNVLSIKGDGEQSFMRLHEYFPTYFDTHTGKHRRREFYFQKSPYTYHNKTIDAVMRTLRDALGPNTKRYWDGEHDEIIQQLVEYYNNTWHRAIDMTPTEMHRDVEIEWAYIRHMTEVLNDVKREQILAMYHSYKPNQRLMLHLEYGKTRDKFKKRRRQFEHVGTFIEYRNGNVVVQVDAPINKVIEIPIFYTRPISKNSTRERDTFEGFHESEL